MMCSICTAMGSMKHFEWGGVSNEAILLQRDVYMCSKIYKEMCYMCSVRQRLSVTTTRRPLLWDAFVPRRGKKKRRTILRYIWSHHDAPKLLWHYWSWIEVRVICPHALYRRTQACTGTTDFFFFFEVSDVPLLFYFLRKKIYPLVPRKIPPARLSSPWYMLWCRVYIAETMRYVLLRCKGLLLSRLRREYARSQMGPFHRSRHISCSNQFLPKIDWPWLLSFSVC